MMTVSTPTQAFLDVFGRLVLVNAISAEGRHVVVDHGGTEYGYYATSVIPAEAVTFEGSQMKVAPFKWAGTDEGVHSCDHIHSNRPE